MSGGLGVLGVLPVLLLFLSEACLGNMEKGKVLGEGGGGAADRRGGEWSQKQREARQGGA